MISIRCTNHPSQCHHADTSKLIIVIAFCWPSMLVDSRSLYLVLVHDPNLCCCYPTRRLWGHCHTVHHYQLSPPDESSKQALFGARCAAHCHAVLGGEIVQHMLGVAIMAPIAPLGRQRSSGRL